MVRATSMVVSARLADAEVGAPMPNSHHCAICYDHIGILSLLGQLPFGRGEREQQPLKPSPIKEVHLGSTIPGMAAKIQEPQNLLLTNSALSASLYGMCGVLHCPSPLCYTDPILSELGIPASGSIQPIRWA